MTARRDGLVAIWHEAVAKMDAAALVRAALAGEDGAKLGPGPVWIVALGKVAGAMASGAQAALGVRVERTLVVQGAGGVVPPNTEVLVGEHPVPGAGSFVAGARVLEVAGEARASGARVIVLVSGGASALCEAPAPGHTREEVAAAQRALVESGAPIAEVNRARRALSAIKGGGLARALGTALARVLVLADVASGLADDVGSGPATPSAAPTTVLATPMDLACAAAECARARGVRPVVVSSPPVDGESAQSLAARIVDHLARGDGLLVMTGETSVALPPGARGHGGRAQHLALEALAAARDLGRPFAFLAGASDGKDGDAGAGAAIDERVFAPAAEIADALTRFDSAGFHARHGTQLPGAAPTTNLTDLYLALSPSGGPDV